MSGYTHMCTCVQQINLYVVTGCTLVFSVMKPMMVMMERLQPFCRVTLQFIQASSTGQETALGMYLILCLVMVEKLQHVMEVLFAEIEMTVIYDGLGNQSYIVNYTL